MRHAVIAVWRGHSGSCLIGQNLIETKDQKHGANRKVRALQSSRPLFLRGLLKAMLAEMFS